MPETATGKFSTMQNIRSIIHLIIEEGLIKRRSIVSFKMSLIGIEDGKMVDRADAGDIVLSSLPSTYLQG